MQHITIDTKLDFILFHPWLLLSRRLYVQLQVPRSVLILVPLIPVHTFSSLLWQSISAARSPGSGAPAEVHPASPQNRTIADMIVVLMKIWTCSAGSSSR